MKNRHNLPQWLCDTVKYLRDKYNPGESDYTATSLLKPPMMYALEKKHEDEIETDVADNLASFFGTSVHDAIESALVDNDRYIVEKRFYRKIRVDDAPGRKKVFLIGGQVDLYDKETKQLSDHKYTSIMKYLMGDKSEYESQLAINRWLLRGNGYDVDSVAINLLAKDWRKGEMRRNPDYPPTPFVPLHLPLWEDEDVETFIRNQIIEKEHAKLGTYRVCTEEERWTRPSKYAVMKKGRKSAVRVLDTEEQAKDYMKDLDKKHYIEHRPGENIRCEQYCNVAEWCPWFNEDKT